MKHSISHLKEFVRLCLVVRGCFILSASVFRENGVSLGVLSKYLSKGSVDNADDLVDEKAVFKYWSFGTFDSITWKDPCVLAILFELSTGSPTSVDIVFGTLACLE